MVQSTSPLLSIDAIVQVARVPGFDVLGCQKPICQMGQWGSIRGYPTAFTRKPMRRTRLRMQSCQIKAMNMRNFDDTRILQNWFPLSPSTPARQPGMRRREKTCRTSNGRLYRPRNSAG